MRAGLETIYLSGLSPTEMTDVGNLAKNVFEVQQAVADPTAGNADPARAGKDAERLQRHHARAAGRAQPGAA